MKKKVVAILLLLTMGASMVFAQDYSNQDLEKMSGVIGNLATSSEFAKLVQAMNQAKESAKVLGNFGNMLTVLDIMTDLTKIGDYLVKYNKTTDPKAKKDLEKEIAKVMFKLVRTGLAVAFPAVGWLDFGVCTIYSFYSVVQQKKQEELERIKNMQERLAAFNAMKKEYDKQSWALKEPKKRNDGIYNDSFANTQKGAVLDAATTRYFAEIHLYGSGIKKEAILSIRSAVDAALKKIENSPYSDKYRREVEAEIMKKFRLQPGGVMVIRPAP